MSKKEFRITVDTPFRALKGKVVKVYQKPYTKEDYEGKGVITKVRSTFQNESKNFADCDILFSVDESPVLRTIGLEDLV